jgi:hypothetical protein
MVLPVNTVCTPLQPQHFPRATSRNGTARFDSQRVTSRHARALLFLVVPLSFGCAGRAHVRDRIPAEQTFWNGCQETVPANADGFQHFVCADVRNKQWEVLIRREPK